MHVSLPRRQQRFGSSMQYLLWICFGLLAIAPWQLIRGQDEAVITADDPEVAEFTKRPSRSDTEKRSKPNSSRNRSASRRFSDPNQIELLTPTFRGQTPPASPEMFPPSGDVNALAPNPQPGPYPLSAIPSDVYGNDSTRRGQALGAQVKMGVLTGPAIGRNKTITPIEGMPFSLIDDNLFFADVRFFTDYAKGFGGNFGGGYRRYLPAFDRILGVNAYFDYDSTSGATFRQVGFGAESLGKYYDIRANAYLPTGPSSEQVSLSNIDGTQKFAGHLLLVDQLRTTLNALHGFDVEFGVPIPGRIPEGIDLKFFGGGYWYESNNIDAFAGWKGRMQATVLPGVDLQLQVSNDPQFNTLVMFGASWTFGGYKQPDGERPTQYARMTTPVLRQYNIVVGEKHEVLDDTIVINPATGTPYFFEHVASNATGPVFDGTVENPFKTVLDAQAVPVKDIIFVHGNSTFDGVNVVLQDNVRVLGEASTIDHAVATSSGDLLLPHPTAGTSVRPIFTNLPGDGVTLANNSEFSGFQIGTSTPGSGATGVGIFGNNIGNVLIRQTEINSDANDAVLLTNTTGNIRFQGDVINQTSASSAINAFHVDSAIGNIFFTSDPPLRTLGTTTAGVINNTGGTALLIENTLGGSLVSFDGSTINDNIGNGIQIFDNAGQIVLGDANLSNVLLNGLNIQNNSGIINDRGNLIITNVTGDAINIKNQLATSQVNFVQTNLGNRISISGRLARGINLEDNLGSVQFSTPVTITAPGTVALPAIEYHGSSGDASFQNITIGTNGTPGSGGGRGILIDPSLLNPTTGRFTVFGITNIFNTLDDAITVTDADSIVAFNGAVNIVDRNAIGIEIFNTRGNVNFNGTATITNTNLFTNLPGIDIRGNTASIQFTDANVIGAVGPAAPGFGGVGVNVGGTSAADVNPGSVKFTILDVDSTDGIALFANNVGVLSTTSTELPTLGLSIGAGNIVTQGATAVDLENSVLDVVLTSVTSTDSPTTGITLIDNTPQSNTTNPVALDTFAFTVTGVTGGGVGSGGTISGAQVTGVLIQNTSTLTRTFTNINTGPVALNLMRITGNVEGINASNTLRLAVNQSEISSNLTNGITGRNIAEVDISNTLFNNNGAGVLVSGVLVPSGNAINLTADSILPIVSPTNGTYLWNIFDNSTINGFNAGIFSGTNSADAVVITNTNRLQDPLTGFVTPMQLTFTNNNVVGPAGTATTVLNSQNTKLSDLAINWVGPESGFINLNTFTINGNQNGITIVNNDTQFLTAYNILGNLLTATGGGNTGLFVNNLGPTNLQVGNFIATDGTIFDQTFTFTTAGGAFTSNASDVGMQFSAGSNSTINVFSNTIDMTSDNLASRGLVYQFLQAPTTALISNNIISVDNGTTARFAGQGINFVSSNGIISLGGTFNNIVSINGSATQAGTPWVNVSASASTNGTFRVNTFSVP